MQSDMCVYTYILHNIEMHVWQKKYQKIMTAVNAVHQGNLPACHFWHMCHWFVTLLYIFSLLYDYGKLVPLHKQVNSNVMPQSLPTGSGRDSIALLTLHGENSYCHRWSCQVK